jgi:hypothetical protein
LKDKFCEIFIFPKLDKEYSFSDESHKFNKNDVILFYIKAKPKRYELKAYIK